MPMIFPFANLRNKHGSVCSAGSLALSGCCRRASSPCKLWCPAPHASRSELVESCCLLISRTNFQSKKLNAKKGSLPMIFPFANLRHIFVYIVVPSSTCFSIRASRVLLFLLFPGLNAKKCSLPMIFPLQILVSSHAWFTMQCRKPCSVRLL